MWGCSDRKCLVYISRMFIHYPTHYAWCNLWQWCCLILFTLVKSTPDKVLHQVAVFFHFQLDSGVHIFRDILLCWTLLTNNGYFEMSFHLLLGSVYKEKEEMAVMSEVFWLCWSAKPRQSFIFRCMFCEAPALLLGSHSWVKWRRFLSSCTFSHFSRPSIMHLQIKIEGTLEDLLVWVCMLCTHTHTYLHTQARSCSHSKAHLTSTTCPHDTHSNVSPSIGWTLTPSHMQYTVYRVAFPPGPLLLRAPWQRGGSSRVSTPGTGRALAKA